MSTTTHLDEFILTIANECHALEMALSHLGNDYHETPRLLGKSWFAVSLESNEKDEQQDNVNKGNVVKRMIDSIISFINRIVERIKAFFGKTDKKKVEETAQAAKSYTSPSDEELFRAVDEFIRSSEKDNAHTQQKTSELKDHEAIKPFNAADASLKAANKSAKDTGKSLQGAIDKLSEELGKKASKDDVVEVFVNEKVKKAQARLGSQGVALIAAAADPRFYKRFQEGIKLLEELSRDSDVYKMVHNREKYESLQRYTEVMNSIKTHIEDLGEEHGLKALEKWVMNTDHLISTQATGYILGGMDLMFSENFMTGAAKRLEAYKNDTHDSNAVDNVKEVQKCITAFTNFFTLAMNVHSRAKSLVEIVRS